VREGARLARTPLPRERRRPPSWRPPSASARSVRKFGHPRQSSRFAERSSLRALRVRVVVGPKRRGLGAFARPGPIAAHPLRGDAKQRSHLVGNTCAPATRSPRRVREGVCRARSCPEPRDPAERVGELVRRDGNKNGLCVGCVVARFGLGRARNRAADEAVRALVLRGLERRERRGRTSLEICAILKRSSA
jgi:hypothetical protein